ncbi:MAG: hypothetical protein QM529_05880 [Hydrotalea sp.]|nr:hypothetical protein [Hydrotalea sp.]
MAKQRDKKRLKIAVLLAGNLRTFEQTAPFLKRYLLNRYDSDVFIYAPNQLEHTAITHHGMTGGRRQSPKEITPEITTRLHLFYKPIKLVISDAYKKINTDGVWNFFYKLKNGKKHAPLTGCYRMFFNWREVNKLWQAHAKKNKKNYDYVVFIRPDVLLLEAVKLEAYEDFFNFNKKSIVFYYGHGDVVENKIMRDLLVGGSDRIVFAKPEVMKIFLNIFDHFDRYFKTAHQLPLPLPIRRSFENLQILYAIEQGLLPLFGKINHVLKRAKDRDDEIFIFFDRINYSMKSIPRNIRRTLLHKRIKASLRWTRYHYLVRLYGRLFNLVLKIYLRSPCLNKPWRKFKKIIRRKKK